MGCGPSSETDGYPVNQASDSTAANGNYNNKGSVSGGGTPLPDAIEHPFNPVVTIRDHDADPPENEEKNESPEPPLIKQEQGSMSTLHPPAPEHDLSEEPPPVPTKPPEDMSTEVAESGAIPRPARPIRNNIGIK